MQFCLLEFILYAPEGKIRTEGRSAILYFGDLLSVRLLGSILYIVELCSNLENMAYLRWAEKTFTTDFEVTLYSAFNDVFSKEVKDLKHIGCFYHYMFNIIKN